MKSAHRQKIFDFIANEAFLCIIVVEKVSKDCLFINPVAKECLELPQNMNYGDFALSGLIPEEVRPGYTAFSQEVLENHGFRQGILMKRHTGQVFIADVGVRETQVEDSTYLVIMFRDVSLQAKLQRDILHKQTALETAFAEMQEQNLALKSLDESKDKFIALTTHELKTPLSAMIATAEVLKLGLYDNDQQLKEFIETIYSEGKHLLEIVQDILDLSKIKAGKMDFFIEKKCPIDIIEQHLKAFETMASEKEISLTFIKHIACQENVYYDELRLKQVLANIISNAIKFSKKKTSVSVELQEDDENLFVWVHDEGPGIPTEHRDRIFNEFETVGNMNSHHRGTGLGMPISKKLMEGMGGEIGYKSEEGKGTSFYVRLPKSKVLDESNYRERPDYAKEVA